MEPKQTCLKLKEAGFPQVYRKGELSMDFAYYNDELHMLHLDADTGDWIGNDYSVWPLDVEEVQEMWVKCPTLSELIEACIELEPIGFHLRRNVSGLWVAVLDDRTLVGTSGDTPEEAVANLYLSLHK